MYSRKDMNCGDIIEYYSLYDKKLCKGKIINFNKLYDCEPVIETENGNIIEIAFELILKIIKNEADNND